MPISKIFSLYYDEVEMSVNNFPFSIFKIMMFENRKKFPGKTPYTPSY